MIDGPFAEAGEIVAGYWILQVKSMDEAIEWAKRLPFEAGGESGAEGEIEIRQVFELDVTGQTTWQWAVAPTSELTSRREG